MTTTRKRPRHRLMVKEIVSVGAVDEPDDPEARILFWKRRGIRNAPDAQAEYRKAHRDALVRRAVAEYRADKRKETPVVFKQEPNPDELMQERCAAAIHQASRRLLWRKLEVPNRERGLSAAKLRVALWQTPEGQAVNALAQSKYGRMRYDKALAALERDPAAASEHKDALRILSDGFPIPD